MQESNSNFSILPGSAVHDVHIAMLRSGLNAGVIIIMKISEKWGTNIEVAKENKVPIFHKTLIVNTKTSPNQKVVQ